MLLRFHDFMHSWLDLVARAAPGFAERLDFPAFELALTDVANGQVAADLSPKRLEALADWMLHLSESLLADLQKELERDAHAKRAASALTALFLRDQGSSISNPELRRLRHRACADFIEILEAHFERVAERRRHALRMREQRRTSKLFNDPNLEPPADGIDPAEDAALREGAQRAVDRVRTMLTPDVFAFLRASFLTPGFVASRAATKFHASSSALTRARHRLREVLTIECSELAGSSKSHFATALTNAFSASN